MTSLSFCGYSPSIWIRSLAKPDVGSAPSQKYLNVWCWIFVSKSTVALSCLLISDDLHPKNKHTAKIYINCILIVYESVFLHSGGILIYLEISLAADK